MSSIDKRIVQMQFDNQGFEKGVSTTMKSLQNLNESLKMKNATNGLSDVQSGINKLTSLGMGALSSGVDAVSTKFNALGIIAATALMNITNQAISTGKRIVSALSIDPIMDGFTEYETKMNAIQTILTNTASKGTTMDDVTAALAKLNEYADKTIYNFADMTKNIGTFTAAGIDLDRSVTAIKGIANLAAGSGSSAAQASTAMYQLSQALASGRVSLQDWNSVVNAGMGGELFQSSLKDMAKSMGIYVDKSKPFRETLQDGWLTSEVLIKTLEKFANDESLIKAATEVKTFTQLIDTMKESVGSGWATTWEYIIGDKEQAAEFFTTISDGFNNIIQPATDARNEMFKYWNEYGGRSAVIEGLTNVVKGLGKVLGSIGDAWREVFPSMTGEKLVELSHNFKVLTEKFKISDETAKKIKTTFKGLFDILPLGKDAIVSVINGIKPLGKIFEGIGPKILDTASKFGEFISNMRKSASEIGFFESISSGLSKAFEGIVTFILGLKERVGTILGYISDLNFQPIFDAIGNGFKAVYNLLRPIFDGIGEVIGSINMDSFYDMIKGGILVQLVKLFKGVFDEIKGIGDSANGFVDSLSEISSNVSEVLNSVKDTLASYQRDLNASTLLKMAGAIAILAGSLLLLSSIDSDRLAVGLGGLSVVIAELVGAFALMQKLDILGSGGLKASTFFISFATSVLIMASALKRLSEINPEQMMTGIIGLTATMLIAVSAVKRMSKNTGKIVSASTGLVIFAAALHIMASAVEKFGSIDSEAVGSGLLAIGVLLSELAIFMIGAKFGGLGISSATGILILSAALLVLKEAVEGFGNMDPKAIILGLSGIALILSEIALFGTINPGGFTLAGLGVALNIIATSLIVLANAVKMFGELSWGEIGRGLIAMAGGLTVLGVASYFISGAKMATLGIGIGVMAVSIGLLGAALKSLGNMSWEEIGKGLVVLAGALTILSVAMYAMSGTIVGAAALVVVAGAMAILTPQLLMLSSMDLAGVGIALLAMAGAFTILGLAGLLLTPVVPTLLALSGVVVLLGVGAAACGAGLMLAGTGFGLLGAAVAGSGFLILEFLKSLIDLIPKIGEKLAEGFVNFALTLSTNAPVIVGAIQTLITVLLEAIRTLIPEMINIALEIIIALADALKFGVPYLVEAGLQLLLGVLQGIADNIQRVVELAGDIIIGFCDGLANKLPDVIASAANLAITFIEGLANAINENHERLAKAIENLVKAIVNAFVTFTTKSFPEFRAKAKEMWENFIAGCKEKLGDAKKAGQEIVKKVKAAIVEKVDSLREVGRNLIKGFMGGIKSMAQGTINAVKGVVQGAINGAKALLGINSPSKVFMEIGGYTSEGFAIGLDKYAHMASDSASRLADNVIKSVKNPLSNISKILNDDINVNPVIRPVVDLSNVKEGNKLVNDMFSDQSISLNGNSRSLAGTVGEIQNENNNKDIIDALKDLKEGLNNGPSYTINGITYDDGSNVTKAVETLVRAAKIERRL